MRQEPQEGTSLLLSGFPSFSLSTAVRIGVFTSAPLTDQLRLCIQSPSAHLAANSTAAPASPLDKKPAPAFCIFWPCWAASMHQPQPMPFGKTKTSASQILAHVA